jgi:uncharacterized protein YjiS (DUF1127 family)
MNSNTIQLDTKAGAAISRHRPAPVTGWLDAARGVLAAFRRVRQRRRAINELSRMSDWRLADMGIPRDRIPEVVDGLIAREGPRQH